MLEAWFRKLLLIWLLIWFCPILIPAKSSYTNLVIAHNHVNSGHMSIHHTRSKLRNRFWIPKDTPIIKSVLNKCQVCFDQRGQIYHVQDNPDLPEFRFDCSHPWKETFLDMTNHYLLRINMVTHLPCMPPRKLFQIHLKGSVLRIGFPKMKSFLTRVAMFKLLIMKMAKCF